MIKFSRFCTNWSLIDIRKGLFGSKLIPIPFLADSIRNVTIVNYLVKEGDFVKQDDEVMEVESHKGTMKIRASMGGKVLKYLCSPTSDVPIGTKYIEIDPDAVPGEQIAKQTPQDPTEKLPKEKTDSIPKEASVPKPETEAKSRKVETKAPEKAQSNPATSYVENQSITQGFLRKETREKLSRLRRTVSERLKESQNTNATVTTMQEIDMSEIMKLRKELGDEFLKNHGVKIGFMSFFIKAVTRALLERPIVNSVIDGNDILHRNYIDISVAVSSPKGLVVPVLKNTQFMNFAEIEQTLVDLSKRASNGLLTLEEMTGGTFTISNGGIFGSMLSIPIINPPQSAVLGMHNIVNRPVVRGDQIVARPIMYISMSYDHRLLDGREGASFLKRVADLIEDPRKMLLEF